MNRALSRAVKAACAATLSIGLAAAQPASAAPLPINNWSANVTTHIGALINTDVTIPAGTFNGSAELTTGDLSGHLVLPSSTFTFNALFLLPTTVTFNVVEAAPTTGNIDIAAGTITASASFNVVLSSVKLIGIEVLDSTQTCKTVTPSTATLTGTADIAANPAVVHLTGNYEIAALDVPACGWLGSLLSGFTAGPMNTLDVTLSGSLV
jgi:hypothetical protein